MVDMDLKGITWVGHVYQKFEAVCLEVEEIMYQDTVQYMENQVQTVGESVKKFYSDVMQDFLPPCSMDPEKESAASNLFTEQLNNIVNHKRSKADIAEETLKGDMEHWIEDSQTPNLDKKIRHRPCSHGFRYADALLKPSLGNTARGSYADLYSKRSNNRKLYNKPSLGVKRISKIGNLPPSGTSEAVTRMGKDLSRVSLLSEPLDKDQEASRNQRATISTPGTDKVSVHNMIEESFEEFKSDDASGIQTDSPSSIKCEETKNASICPPSDGFSAELNAADSSTTNGLVFPVGSSVNLAGRPSEYPNKSVLLHRLGQPDDSCTDTTDSDIVPEHHEEALREGNNQVAEETCVLVNGDELPSVPHKEQKQRPYKKKIQHAIYSKMRSARKQEYKQLAEWYGAAVTSDKEITKTLMPLSHDTGESDWELL